MVNLHVNKDLRFRSGAGWLGSGKFEPTSRQKTSERRLDLSAAPSAYVTLQLADRRSQQSQTPRRPPPRFPVNAAIGTPVGEAVPVLG